MGSSAPRRSAEPRFGRIGTVLAAVAALVPAAGTGPCAAHEPDDRLPAAVTMDFVPPPPGSYPLHAIMRAPDGPVLDRDGRRLPLRHFTSGKITLLGFIYTSCADPRGCPLTSQVFHTVRHRVEDLGGQGTPPGLGARGVDEAEERDLPQGEMPERQATPGPSPPPRSPRPPRPGPRVARRRAP